MVLPKGEAYVIYITAARELNAGGYDRLLPPHYGFYIDSLHVSADTNSGVICVGEFVNVIVVNLKLVLLLNICGL